MRRKTPDYACCTSGKPRGSPDCGKASRWNNELQLEVSGVLLDYLVNAMYVEPPPLATSVSCATESKKRQRHETAPYADYPNVKRTIPKGGGPVLMYVRPRLQSGRYKQITRTIPVKASQDADGGVGVELRLAAELEGLFMAHDTRGGGSSSVVAQVADGVEEAVVGDGAIAGAEEDGSVDSDA